MACHPDETPWAFSRLQAGKRTSQEAFDTSRSLGGPQASTSHQNFRSPATQMEAMPPLRATTSAAELETFTRPTRVASQPPPLESSSAWNAATEALASSSESSPRFNPENLGASPSASADRHRGVYDAYTSALPSHEEAVALACETAQVRPLLRFGMM